MIKCEAGRAQGKPTEDGASVVDEKDIPPMPDSFLLAECGDYEKAYTRWKVRWCCDGDGVVMVLGVVVIVGVGVGTVKLFPLPKDSDLHLNTGTFASTS